jgi:hypothetical protein
MYNLQYKQFLLCFNKDSFKAKVCRARNLVNLRASNNNACRKGALRIVYDKETAIKIHCITKDG